MTYETDDEKVEAIKKWWKDNGPSVIAGVVLGLVAIYGWRYWVDYRNDVAGKASTAFEQLAMAAAAGDAAAKSDSVAEQAKALKDDYGSTPYPALGALIAAKTLYEAGKTAEAKAELQSVIAAAPDPAFERIAALRLARIQVAEGDLDGATATLAAHDSGPAFAGEFAAVRGDIALARGDTAAARKAYEQALAQGASLSQLIRLALDNLPAAG